MAHSHTPCRTLSSQLTTKLPSERQGWLRYGYHRAHLPSPMPSRTALYSFGQPQATGE
ncbi:hypothetical protein J9253_09380 [Thiothrix litoralis]|uniref:Uncharacterized protein n=1 Tax=Thiothrix litoralis TaxID=2891210 RepID=A0ABX7WWP6_9GAMM|nr:hypothetical protein [Thiothrix litoralis]QTR48100.1 hypothetical protein J9253_09380 [Thiothrix litoralis]